MKTSFIILSLLLFKSATSQSLIPDAQKIKIAFEKLSKDSSSKELQRNYIDSFPSETKTFLRVFQTKNFDQLYFDSYKYIETLEKCAIAFPKEVIDKCVDICKNLVWDADAVGQLQHISVKINAENVTAFTSKYKTLSAKEQDSLIIFYADVENHNAFAEYQELIDKLNSINEINISKKLEADRTIREKRNGH